MADPELLTRAPCSGRTRAKLTASAADEDGLTKNRAPSPLNLSSVPNKVRCMVREASSTVRSLRCKSSTVPNTPNNHLVMERRQSATPNITPKVKYEDLEGMEYIGSGNFADVYKAELRGQTVAVKISKTTERENVSQLWSEQAILAEVSHMNCINILGKGSTPEDESRPFIVLEYLEGGDMKFYLNKEMQRKKSFVGILFGGSRQGKFGGPRFQQRLDLCLQLARALAYAHHNCLSAKGQALLHRDLKPANLLLSASGRLVLADFGLAKPQRNAPTSSSSMDDPFTMSGETGTMRYMAPENARCESYGTAADTYSFGVLAWQILTLKIPFKGVTTDTFMDRVVNGNERPPIPKRWPLALGQLLQRCWAPNPNDRPPMGQVKAELEVIKNELYDPNT
mmetsp:Transcript_23620/g.37358  ORF Transcript_23620/g.37358 Transcript_23620/m.37358 type:complete len:397 (-) Transcript_23620:188-1378(-)